MPPKTINAINENSNICLNTNTVSSSINWDGYLASFPIGTIIDTSNTITTAIPPTLKANTSDEIEIKGVTFTVELEEFHPEWNCKPDNIKYYNPCIISMLYGPVIVNINIIIPNKVVEVTIFDGEIHTYKQVCKAPDVFDFKYALALAWAKYTNETRELGYTLEGIEALAHEYMWKYVKLLKEINRAIKTYNKWCKAEAKKEAEEKERQAIIERRKAKNKKRKEKMLAKKKEEEISTIAEAIKRSKE